MILYDKTTGIKLTELLFWYFKNLRAFSIHFYNTHTHTEWSVHTNHIEVCIEENGTMFVGGLTLIHCRVSEHNIPHDKDAT